MADFMVIQCICVALVLVFPDIAMWFPQWLNDRVKAERMKGDPRPVKLVPLAAAPDPSARPSTP
jgi:hypothetical protein